jgi:hypothetical protein
LAEEEIGKEACAETSVVIFVLLFVTYYFVEFVVEFN